jgi:pyrroloquinoline-quinone synthase
MALSHDPPWSPEDFETQLRAQEYRYHIHHPFHIMMDEGKLSREQIQGWVANRYYYQIKIPLKDAALIANCPEREVRRRWFQRIVDHDGDDSREGGIEAWLRLAEACGLERGEVLSEAGVLPGVRFAVDAYVNFVRQVPWQEGVCASLTELFAPNIHRQRLAGWPQNYPWIDPKGLQYFRNRLSEAPRDVAFGLQLTLQHFHSRQQQQRALEILQFKLDVLWSMLDAMYLAYVAHMPPYHNVGKTR